LRKYQCCGTVKIYCGARIGMPSGSGYGSTKAKNRGSCGSGSTTLVNILPDSTNVNPGEVG
jgi:hypothetical protein